MMPNPFYQIYEGAALLAGAEPYYLDTLAENRYLPDLQSVPEEAWRRCQLLFLCSPGNPTGAVMNRSYLAEALALADRYGFVIAADECYADIYLDESSPPPACLKSARQHWQSRFERCVAFHSLSKRSSVPGLRSGFVAGDPADPATVYLLYRTYHGAAMGTHVQVASTAAWNDDAHAATNRTLYREKFAQVIPSWSRCCKRALPLARSTCGPRCAATMRLSCASCTRARTCSCFPAATWRAKAGTAIPAAAGCASRWLQAWPTVSRPHIGSVNWRSRH